MYMWCEKRFKKTGARNCSRPLNKAWLVFPEMLALTSWSRGPLNWILQDWSHIPTKLARQIEASRRREVIWPQAWKREQHGLVGVVCSWEIMEGEGRGLWWYLGDHKTHGEMSNRPSLSVACPSTGQTFEFSKKKVRNTAFMGNLLMFNHRISSTKNKTRPRALCSLPQSTQSEVPKLVSR